MSKKNKKPIIYTDGNIDTKIAKLFKDEGFKVIEISKVKRFEKKDERDFVPNEIWRKNGIFITSDREFAEEIINTKMRHKGIVFIPQEADLDYKIHIAELMQIIIKNIPPIEGIILYIDHDGIKAMNTKNSKDKTLIISWHRIGG